jgi:hypothetical protein
MFACQPLAVHEETRRRVDPELVGARWRSSTIFLNSLLVGEAFVELLLEKPACRAS